MKRILFFSLLSLFLFSCEGERGPTGPAGPPGPIGPTGPSGASIIYIFGSISVSDYNPPFIELYDPLIDEIAVTQVYLTPDKNVYAWMFIEDFQLTDGLIYIYDPDILYFGWDYMIMIIEYSGG